MAIHIKNSRTIYFYAWIFLNLHESNIGSECAVLVVKTVNQILNTMAVVRDSHGDVVGTISDVFKGMSMIVNMFLKDVVPDVPLGMYASAFNLMLVLALR